LTDCCLEKTYFEKDIYLANFLDKHSITNLEEAYLMQKQWVSLFDEHFGGVSGYKLAYTTKVMQERVGLNSPAYGLLPTDKVYYEGQKLYRSDYYKLGFEAEIALKIGEDITSDENISDIAKLSKKISMIAPAFEVIDGRADPSMSNEERLLLSVAMNIFNEGIVLGDWIENWESIDLPNIHCSMSINESVVGTGIGSDVMGNPLNSCLWLINELKSQGKGLEKGMIIITGSLISPKMVDEGDVVNIDMSELGQVNTLVI
jgi:2-keto-4-pentenoate hydratase